MASALDAIAKAAEQEPVDLPRLTAANVLIHVARIGTCLEIAVNEYRKIPEAKQNSFDPILRNLIGQCETVIKTASRLIEANR